MGLESVVLHSKNLAKGVRHGSVHGLYAPFAYSSYRSHKKQNLDAVYQKKMHKMGNLLGFVGVSLFVHVPFVLYAAASGSAFAYLGALVASNTLDYVIRTKR